MKKVFKKIKAYNELGSIRQEEWEQVIQELQEQNAEFEIYDNYAELKKNELNKRVITIYLKENSITEEQNSTEEEKVSL